VGFANVEYVSDDRHAAVEIYLFLVGMWKGVVW
jgi:hypothetical protein